MCEKCGLKPATIHITENLRSSGEQGSGTPVAHHYCEECGRPLLPTARLAAETSFSGPTLRTELYRQPAPNPLTPEPQIDTSKRYDIYCIEPTRDVVVYRNALFKGASTLLPGPGPGGRIVHHDFIELEQANGQALFISRTSIVRFCQPGTAIVGEIIRKG